MPAGYQHPGALTQARPLVGPVVERGRAGDQVEDTIWVGQPFGGTHRKSQAPVIGRLFGSLDHGWRGIDPSQLGCVRAPPGQQAQQVSGATADVEHTPGRRMHRQGELRRPVGDVMMQAAARALLVTGGSFVEGSDIAVRRHTGSLADQPATRCGARRAASLPQVARRLPVSRHLTTSYGPWIVLSCSSVVNSLSETASNVRASPAFAAGSRT